MKDIVVQELSKLLSLDKEKLLLLIETPPSKELGDFSFPCFTLAKELKKNPVEIAKDISSKIKSNHFEKVEAKGPYINFYIDKKSLAKETLLAISKEKDKYGSSKEGKGKTLLIDLSAPNIAKPFGIGHLRSTIIGNSLASIYSFSGYKTVKINYLGDWGTQFGKLIAGYKKFGDEKKLKSNPISHLQEIYVKVNSDPDMDEIARSEFKSLEDGDEKNLKLWKRFRKLSLEEFDKIYSLLGVEFDVISGESFYNDKMDKVVNMLEKKKLLELNQGALVVDLSKYNLGVCLIKKTDGATLYATRDITAAIDRFQNYKFDKMIYEVGAEQKLHFKQFFKVLKLAGFDFADNCVHVAHGLYLDNDGKKFSTRKGKIVQMSDVLDEVIALATEEILKRDPKISKTEIKKRAKLIALSAIIYGDLKNFRENDAIFDIDRFVSFEGNTGPYLLYTYARAKSILFKSNKKLSYSIKELSSKEGDLVFELSRFPLVVREARESYSPNLIANYAFDLSQKFNEFYHSEQVIGSETESFKLALVNSFSQVLKNSLSLLGIKTLEKM